MSDPEKALREALEAVLIFLASSHRPLSKQRWREIIGEKDMTVRVLVEHIRGVLKSTERR